METEVVAMDDREIAMVTVHYCNNCGSRDVVTQHSKQTVSSDAPNTRQRAERAARSIRDRYTMVVRDVLIDHAPSCGNAIYCDCEAAAIREQIVATIESTPVADIIAAEFEK